MYGDLDIHVFYQLVKFPNVSGFFTTFFFRHSRVPIKQKVKTHYVIICHRFL